MGIETKTLHRRPPHRKRRRRGCVRAVRAPTAASAAPLAPSRPSRWAPVRRERVQLGRARRRLRPCRLLRGLATTPAPEAATARRLVWARRGRAVVVGVPRRGGDVDSLEHVEEARLGLGLGHGLGGRRPRACSKLSTALGRGVHRALAVARQHLGFGLVLGRRRVFGLAPKNGARPHTRRLLTAAPARTPAKYRVKLRPGQQVEHEENRARCREPVGALPPLREAVVNGERREQREQRAPHRADHGCERVRVEAVAVGRVIAMKVF
eukprot:scaffold99640_cov78-Phaeocystis_antarctica.AAC.1